MDCWVGGEVAAGICRFCGRGVCKEHAKQMPFVTAIYRRSEGLKGKPGGLEGIAVDGVLWCGECRPSPDPIRLDFLEPADKPSTGGG